MSVYKAEAIVASGVLPWQFIKAFSKATLQRPYKIAPFQFHAQSV